MQLKQTLKVLTPLVFLPFGMETMSANTVTGWDVNGQEGDLKDANHTLDDASKDITDEAKRRADETTNNAPNAIESSQKGWIDVYVDHSKLDDAVRKATQRGVHVVHEESVVKTGDAEQTKQHIEDAEKYYQDTAQTIREVSDKYNQDLRNYRAEVEKNQADANRANAEMDALRSNLAGQGQSTKLITKTYNESELSDDQEAVRKGLAAGRLYLDVKQDVESANVQSDALTLFQTAASQGLITITHETIKVSEVGGANATLQQMEDDYKKLQEFIAQSRDQVGEITNKPVYTVYHYSVDDTVAAEAAKPVTTVHYTPIVVEEPVTPTVSYHYYDVRTQTSTDSHLGNADGDVIVIGPNDNAGGREMAQGVVNQIVGIHTDQQKLPSGRFDKIHDLTIVTVLPTEVEFDEARSNTDPTNWKITYDEQTRTVTQQATAAYLVDVNLNQNPNNQGSVGGTVDGEWGYQAPVIYFKLMKPDHVYQVHSTSIVNHEYMYVGNSLQIRTDSADPSKVNTNSKYQNIDGKVVLPGSINNYVLGWDFDQYKSVNLDREMKKAGLSLIDDFPEEAVQLTGPISIIDAVTGELLFSADTTDITKGFFQHPDGKTTQGITWEIREDAPEGLEDKISGQFISIDVSGEDNSFFADFVETGRNLRVVLPMTTLPVTPEKEGEALSDRVYQNKAFQSDFGKDYESNTVENTVPLIKPSKDAVLSFGDLRSLDIEKKEVDGVENGSRFSYLLKGTHFPMNLSEPIKGYAFVDELPHTADRYDGQYIVESQGEIFFLEGSTLETRYPEGVPANSDIRKYFTQTISRGDNGITRVTIRADRDFLAQIDYNKTAFGVNVFLEVKRVANEPEVKNTFQEMLNGLAFDSNEITTTTIPNALDRLQDQVNGLESTQQEHSEAIKTLSNSLSVVVRGLKETKDQLDEGVGHLQSQIESEKEQNAGRFEALSKQFDHTNEVIIQMEKDVNQKIDQVTGQVMGQVDDLKQAQSDQKDRIDRIEQQVESSKQTVDQMKKDTSTALESLASVLNRLTEQRLSSLTIFEPSVRSQADALQYATNRGVASGSIRSITALNGGGYRVVYNTSKTAINNSSEAVLKPMDKAQTEPSISVPKRDETASSSSTRLLVMRYDFYTLKTEKEVYKRLADLGYRPDQVMLVKQNNGVFTAHVNVGQRTSTNRI